MTVVTTRVGTFDHAMTASAFTSVSLEPVLVLVCVDKEARFRDAVLESGTWAASILSTAGRRAADWFATKGRPLVGQLDRYPHHRGVTGAALLDGSLAWLECRTRAVYDGGDHDIVLGAVIAAVRGRPRRRPAALPPWPLRQDLLTGVNRRLLVAGLGVLGLVVVVWAGLYLAAGSGIARGTTVRGVDIGGQSRSQAAVTLTRALRDDAHRAIPVTRRRRARRRAPGPVRPGLRRRRHPGRRAGPQLEPASTCSRP